MNALVRDILAALGLFLLGFGGFNGLREIDGVGSIFSSSSTQ